jgi:hypothetical protein
MNSLKRSLILLSVILIQSVFCETYSDGGTGIRDESRRWPKVAGKVIVPYLLKWFFTHIQMESIKTAMKAIEEKTKCIEFVEMEHQTDYLYFINFNNTCHTEGVGRQGGWQFLNLANDCFTQRTILHELNHALGFQHMHSHPDRDDFITINFDNINSEGRSDNYSNFAKLDAKDWTNFGTPYDYDSIMHYKADGGAKKYPRFFGLSEEIKTVITSKKDKDFRFENNEMSDGDILRLQRMYKCEETVSLTTTTDA